MTIRTSSVVRRLIAFCLLFLLLIGSHLAGTAVPTASAAPDTEIVVETPSLHPEYGGGMCDSGWDRYLNNRGSYTYLTLNTSDPNQSSNWAEWHATLPVTGRYRVEAYIADHAAIYWSCTGQTISWDTSDARYTIHHRGGTTAVAGDQSPLFNNWLRLGTFDFESGQDAMVELRDLNGEASLSRTISFSAVRFVLEESSPPPSGEIIIEEPTLTPPYDGDMCGSGWYAYANERGHSAYLTLNTNEPAESTNRAEWRPSLSAGWYEVWTYIPNHELIHWSCLNRTIAWDTGDAQYTIHHAYGQETVSANQTPLAAEWLRLGTYYFTSGTDGYVDLVDLNHEPRLTRTVSVSAMRFVPQGDVPPVTPEPAPPTSQGAAIADRARDQTGVPYNPNRQLFCGGYGPWRANYSVCTDLVIDAYLLGTNGIGVSDGCGATNIWYWMRQHEGGVSLEELVYNDGLQYPGRYRWNSARDSEDLRTYLRYNQLYEGRETNWQLGDIAFFDWDQDGGADHVAVVTEVNNGRPAAITHAHGDPGVCNGLACEQEWNGYYEQYVMGHGRLGVNLTRPQVPEGGDTWEALLVEAVGSDTAHVTIYDPAGRTLSDTTDWSLIGANNEDFVPYTQHSYRRDTLGRTEFLMANPAVGAYQVMVESPTSTTMTFTITTVHEAVPVATHELTLTVQANTKTLLPLQITRDGAELDVTVGEATMPTYLEVPEILRATAVPGMPFTLSLPLTTTHQGSETLLARFQLTGLSTQLGDTLPTHTATWDANELLLGPNQTATTAATLPIPVDLAPGRYLGTIVVEEILEAVQYRRVPFELIVESRPAPSLFQMHLPLVTRVR